ncbi:DUF276 domain-containing protein [Borreliella burgdorferi]|uniref:DUF276 domain-containing protein n=1 Tax=Borreliella burgdorferi 118a TaxID=476210 RepID=A0A7U4DJ47_BORBG|nr:DUF276 domain-containing protein [Borreliella burgdorferi]ACL33757.1 conserved hypothetical protein [Borreliella burgdorferi 156a]ACM10057.1 conserved hypothetical protein [Borreliella burgdorferi 72a]ACN93149.1 conserved hypothetical protein [Borreliella burgdorferi 118a]MCD2321469.1 DUF276 domain-containing protein [Borreliella burgdorferi]MCD2375204.1 DUF276 domain-containing protein [Borreliella burgdorferi]
MSIIFDKNLGILEKTIEEIQNEKKHILRTKYGINIKDNSIYDIINFPSSSIDKQISEVLKELFSKIKENGSYFNALKEDLSTPKSSTYEAIRKALLNVEGVKHINILSGPGTINLYLILQDDCFQDQEKKQIKIETKQNIWQAIYYTAPSGTVFKGDIEIEFLNKHNQKKTYKFSLGKKKYAYLKVVYKTEAKDAIYKEIDTQIRDIYNKILTDKYIEMGTSLRYQDFLAPVSIIRGIKELKIGICIKNDETKKITQLNDSDFTFNKDENTKEDEIIIFNTNKRLLINRE